MAVRGKLFALAVCLASTVLYSRTRSDWPHPMTVINTLAPTGLNGTTVIVTGANAGVGLETARALVLAGATVVLACRSSERCESAARQIVLSADVRGDSARAMRLRILPAACDLESPDSLLRFADWVKARFDRIDVLVLNGGVAGIGWLEVRRSTPTGLEKRFGINHVGHHFLTRLLRPLLTAHAEKGRSRVVVVASRSHKFSPSLDEPLDRGLPSASMLEPVPHELFPLLRDLRLYGLSKLCNVLFAKELQRRWDGDVLAVSLHPGSSINTAGGESCLLPRLWLRLVSPWAKTTAQGASTTLFGALSSELHGGEYLDDCRVSEDVHPDAQSRDRAEKLWQHTEMITASWMPHLQ